MHSVSTGPLWFSLINKVLSQEHHDDGKKAKPQKLEGCSGNTNSVQKRWNSRPNPPCRPTRRDLSPALSHDQRFDSLVGTDIGGHLSSVGMGASQLKPARSCGSGQDQTAGLGLSCGCGHNRDDEARFSTGPSQPPRRLDWHRTGRCGSSHRILQRRRCSTGSPQPTGQQRAQGLGEVRAACMGWHRAAEHQHRVRQTAPPLDLGSRQQLISSAIALASPQKGA